MKPSTIKLPLLLLAIPFYFCCKKVINVNINNAAAQIVIQGNVTNAPGPYHVQISQTVNFSADNIFPPVSGAIVKITDVTTGQTDTLTETSEGIYTTTHLPEGVPGHTYQLNITALGQTYTASSTMPQPVTLDSITFQQIKNFGKTRIHAQANFQDPPGIRNFYYYQEYINSQLLQKTFVFNDRLSDGKYITNNLYTDSSYLNPGDTVLLKMNCVDNAVFNYFNTLSQAADPNGFETATPSNPLGNISNHALGYFSANTVGTKKSLVE